MNTTIEHLIRRGAAAHYAHEYGVRTRRLFPWPGMVETKRPLTEAGCMYVLLAPGESVAAHRHDEEETFIVLAGRVRLTIDGRSAEIGPDDVAYIPRGSTHAIDNLSDTEPFRMLDMYWDEGGASVCTIEALVPHAATLTTA